jgi:predicted aldo/keto reductase-like oxidoreductase
MEAVMSERKGKVTRRGFISTAVTGLVSAGVLGVTGRGALSSGEEQKALKGKEPGKILRRTLGRTGIEIPIISMGVMNSDNAALIKASYELGIRHFDTAAYYMQGRNEQIVGKVIKELGVRDEAVIGTKIFHPGYRQETKPVDIKNRIPKLCEESLKRLQMDYVDILYIHNIGEPGVAGSEDIMAAMVKLKEQGKAKHIGVTTHGRMHEIIDEAVEAGVWDVVLTVVNFTLGDYAELFDSIERAASKGVGIIAMKTQAGSQRRSRIDWGDYFATPTVATAALKWVLRNENVTTAIPGYTTFEHMKQDFSVAYGLKYTPEELKLMEDKNIKAAMGFCRQCNVCRGTCPNGADVATLMRTHMYAARYTNFEHARATLRDIPMGVGLDACNSCTSCSARCAHSVDIAGNIEELKLIYS